MTEEQFMHIAAILIKKFDMQSLPWELTYPVKLGTLCTNWQDVPMTAHTNCATYLEENIFNTWLRDNLDKIAVS